MKILVTGATGSIGNYVVNRLFKENCILIAASLIPLDKAKTFNWFSKVVEDYLEQNNKTIKLNLGYYPYPDHEPMAFWWMIQN